MPLTLLTRKDVKFEWGEAQENSFQALRSCLTNSPVLGLPEGSDDFRGKVIAYASRRLKECEKNYPTHDLELAVVVFALKLWRHYLYGTKCQLFPDHRSLMYIFTQQTLNMRQQRAMELKRMDGYAQYLTEDNQGLKVFKDHVWIPKLGSIRELVLSNAHKSWMSVHPGSTKMYYDLKSEYSWPGMKRDIAQYVEQCVTCSQVNAKHQKTYGSLQPLDIPMWKWEEVTMALVTKLPKMDHQHDNIWVVVDRLTKSAHFWPVRELYSMDKWAEIYIDEIIARHGVPLKMNDKHRRSSDRSRQRYAPHLMHNSYDQDLSFGYDPVQQQIQQLANQNMEANGEIARLRALNPQTTQTNPAISLHLPRPPLFQQNQFRAPQAPPMPQVSQIPLMPQTSQNNLRPPQHNNSQPIFPLPSGPPPAFTYAQPHGVPRPFYSIPEPIPHIPTMLEEQNKAMLALLAKLPGAAVPVEVEPKTGFQASPYVDEIALMDIPKKYNIPAFTTKYSGITDPVEHVAQYKQLMWTASIPSQYQEACMFNAEMIEVKNFDIKTAIEAYKRGLDNSSELYTDLTKYPAENFDDVRARTLAHMRIEDDAIFRRKHSNEKKNLGAQKHDFKPKRVNKIENSRQESKARSNKGTGRIRYPDLSTYNFAGTSKELVDSLRKIDANVRWPKKPENPSKDKDQTKWCEFHGDHGHTTDECISLKKEIAYLKSNGHLKGIISDEAKRPASPIHTKVVNCITGGSEVCGLTYSAAKRHAREGPAGFPVPEESKTAAERELDAAKLTFDQDDLSDVNQKHHDALVIQLTIGNCLTKRVLVDGGSSANVIFSDTLKIMGIDRSNIVRRTTTLVGFNGDATNTLGEIVLPVFAKGINKQTKFNVIDCPSTYNAILGRPWIHDMKAIPSTYHQKIKFPSPWGEHSDCFAWSHEDMVGINPDIISHKLNVDPSFKPVKQKRRKFAPERNKVINDEVDNLLKTGKIREVNYPDWLANVVVVQKKNGKWRVCIDFTDLNKACPKDPFPLPHIDVMVDATSGHELLTFMDAYSGYNQISMHMDDQEKTAFMTDKGIYCYKSDAFWSQEHWINISKTREHDVQGTPRSHNGSLYRRYASKV
ncbi:hypothetical protein OSB04_024557 [Centaurea solstitialis]|uniref:RNA-directed DNA polymerase n=1 Tax=Centaurea solstitialis TaxID=347529 RepID=A0AA38WAG4_9ASTR|nr:hypothetical protein OSB04_024557 [Centaurea solstitialis]